METALEVHEENRETTFKLIHHPLEGQVDIEGQVDDGESANVRVSYYLCTLNLLPKMAGFALILAVCATAAEKKKIVTPKDFPAGDPSVRGSWPETHCMFPGRLEPISKTQKVLTTSKTKSASV